ncbi:hypothetical protein [Roseovarius sp. SYSU LYC5161]|uniref:hypothetical protein n=1 Tax=Roseovarius halophilus (ex Wu et al. 2025) TaxID=3376060 RepID=UPI00399B3635
MKILYHKDLHDAHVPYRPSDGKDSPHFDLSKTRLETLAVLLVGLANGRTVNLSHLASQFPGDAQHGSNYRRLQRFFQFVQLDSDIAARLVVRMLNLKRLSSSRSTVPTGNWDRAM